MVSNRFAGYSGHDGFLFTASLEFNLPDLLFSWVRKRAACNNNPHTSKGDRTGQKKRAN